MGTEKSNKKLGGKGHQIGMKTLVTGATGFIGSHLVERLVVEGHDVRCLVRSTSDVRWLKNLPVEITVGDFFNPDSLREVLQDVRVVHHVAGVTKAQRKQEYWRGNSEVTRRLLGATLKFARSVDRFVHISTQAAVGPSYNGTPVNELTAPHPIDVYGKSKKEAEDACLEFSDKLPITIIRPGAVYGPRDHDTFAFFRWIERGILPIIGSEKKKLALIFARDLVDGILLATKNPGAVGQIYFLANEECPTWGELFSVAGQITGKKLVRWRIPNFSIYLVAAAAEPLGFLMGKPALFSFEKAKELAQASWSCDVGKAKRELGYEAKTPIVDGMKETIEWYRREGWLKGTDGS